MHFLEQVSMLCRYAIAVAVTDVTRHDLGGEVSLYEPVLTSYYRSVWYFFMVSRPTWAVSAGGR